MRKDADGGNLKAIIKRTKQESFLKSIHSINIGRS